jgi:phospholipid/cholesterol/gamma-HCH transport system substrate-binding protein
MKNRLKIEISVGLIFFVALSILGYYTVIVSKEVFKSGDLYYLKVHFRNAGALSEDNKVFVNGVYSGTVLSVKLRDEYAEATFEMFNRFRLYSNYEVRVKTEAAIGGKQVMINPGSAMGDDGRVYGQIDAGVILTGGVDDPIESFTSLINDNRENVRVAISNIREFTEKLNSGRGTVSRLLNDEKLANQANDLMEQLKETVEDAREQAPVTSFIRAALTAF